MCSFIVPFLWFYSSYLLKSHYVHYYGVFVIIEKHLHPKYTASILYARLSTNTENSFAVNNYNLTNVIELHTFNSISFVFSSIDPLHWRIRCTYMYTSTTDNQTIQKNICLHSHRIVHVLNALISLILFYLFIRIVRTQSKSILIEILPIDSILVQIKCKICSLCMKIKLDCAEG